MTTMTILHLTTPLDAPIIDDSSGYPEEQFELFATGDAGCVRWGLCDTREDV